MPLPDGARIVVVGGGPAGAFFALRAARNARALNKSLDLIVIEKKWSSPGASPDRVLEGCNYCAGGISPQLFEMLARNGIHLPPEIIEGNVESVVVDGDWKSIELQVPAGKRMLSVFRGTRPAGRPDRYVNFDGFLLEQAVREGVRVVTGEVRQIALAENGKPVVSYNADPRGQKGGESLECDFVAVAAGVNQVLGQDPAEDRFLRSLRGVLPDFRPPKVRRTLIAEMQTSGDALRHLKGEVHFAQHGSKELSVEMSSLMPKGRWLTVVLLGRSVDRAESSERLSVIERFLGLPHIRRLMPRGVIFSPSCVCFPNMTVKKARGFYADRIALVGDIVVSRLYKDGIYSAYLTASALGDCVLGAGIDRGSLEKHYLPAIKRLDLDNGFGRWVFGLSRLTFAHPFLSRIAYQAVLSEVKTKARAKRRLPGVLWAIASGDSSYRQILASMGHPATLWTIFSGGFLVTIRNMITERVFGLSWEGFGRYQTGVALEDLARKRGDFERGSGIPALRQAPQFERMYSIKIKAGQGRIFGELGKFGDRDRQYFKPRLVEVHRTAGLPNELGSSVKYDVAFRPLSFSVVLEKAEGQRFLLYRVVDGFARGGVLIFDIDEVGEDVCLLSIYVSFDFYEGRSLLSRCARALFRLFFPAFVHDVIWNHSLCKLKHVIEAEEGPPPIGEPAEIGSCASPRSMRRPF